MIRDTINLNMEAQVDAGVVFFFFPYPGTRLHEICVENNLLGSGRALSSYTEGPAVSNKWITQKRLKRLYYEFRWLLYRRRLLSSVNMNPALKAVVAAATGAALRIAPGLIAFLIREGPMKSAIRRIIMRRR
jgi:hypothetical protein